MADPNVNSVGAGKTYTTWALWEDDRNGDLVTRAQREKGEGYDETLVGNLLIDGSTTNSSYYMWPTVADGNMHDGTVNSGGHRMKNSGDNAVITNSDDWTLVEKIIVEQNSAADRFAVISSNPAGARFSRLICIRTAGANTGRGIDLFKGTTTDRPVAMNCVVYGVGATKFAIGILLGRGAAYNCTILNCTKGADVGTGGSDIWRNVISMDCGTDFDVTNDDDYCLDSDGTAGGANSIHNKTSANQFVSNTAPYDLHLKAGADALNVGEDQGTSPTLVNIDIDGRDRDAEADIWDMGSDEFVQMSTVIERRFNRGFNRGFMRGTVGN